MASLLLPLLFAFVVWVAPVEGHNITAILDGFPLYFVYNSYLSQTKVCDEINSRETVTCLVLPNAAMYALAAMPLPGIKNALRLLTLLDYFDSQKLHDIPRGTTLTTTLYQTTGNPPDNSGFVNITNLRGGRVAFAAAAPGSTLDSSYTNTVCEVPYNVSVLEISEPIVFPGLLDAPSSASFNLTALLEKAGCKTFASLLASSGVLKIFQSAMFKDLTVFAPNDEAFKAPGVPDLKSLSSAELVTLLQYHALPTYTTKFSLKTSKGRIATMASTGAGKYDFSVISRGDDVFLNTGVDTSRVASTVLDSIPVCVLTVDNLLLPSELFGGAPSPAPAPAALTPSLAPAPAKPKRRHRSLPAPPTPASEAAPAGSPQSAADKVADKKSAAVRPLGTVAAAAAVSTLVALASIL